jgi:hypothetical protein
MSGFHIGIEFKNFIPPQIALKFTKSQMEKNFAFTQAKGL